MLIHNFFILDIVFIMEPTQFYSELKSLILRYCSLPGNSKAALARKMGIEPPNFNVMLNHSKGTSMLLFLLFVCATTDNLEDILKTIDEHITKLEEKAKEGEEKKE